MNNRYRLAITLLLAALLAGGNTTATGVVVRGNVYGGGNLADVGQSVTVNISAGEVRGDVYGGGALANTNTDNCVNDALVYSYSEVTGLIAGTSSVDGFYTRSGSEENYTYTPASGIAVSGTTYYKMDNTITVNLNGGTVKGDVYGGGLGRLESGTMGEDGYLEAKEATEYGDILVTLNGTMLVTGNNNHGRVFGANNINGTPKGHVKVVVNKTTQVSDQAIDVTAVFGGGNQADYNPYSNAEYAEVEINMTAGDNARLFVGNVFGGGNEAGTENTAGTEVNIKAGNVLTGVYGGCNTRGAVNGDTKVSVTGGTIGTVWENAPDTMPTLVFGGGLGHETLVNGSVTVEIGALAEPVAPATEPTISGSATIWGDVYGGSAKGLVNATKGGTEQDPTYTTTSGKTTLVAVYSDTVKGDVYGGGLGDDTYAADVYGNITVNIGSGTVENGYATAVYGNATINGSVYGCNNHNGTPKGDVIVNVYKTAHTTGDNGNTYPTGVVNLNDLATLVADYAEASYSNKFAITAVYGGGNQAAYNPATVAQNETPHSTTVHVYDCSNNTIQTVYGGGNAADATNVNVIIDGGFFDRVFGGGNGYSATGNHSNPDNPNYNPGANISGSATTQIHGGLFRQLFGGSNQYGNVANASLSIDNNSGCTELINESFGGANEATINGNVTTTLACGDNTFESFYGGSNMASINGSVTLNVYGGNYTNVFGGSKGSALVSADISGDVTLNLYGGTMENAFGGSNINGNIGGKITVNVLDNGGTCVLGVSNIYGGGNLTPYTPTYALQEGETERISPVVNLIHGTVANVFGGAKGATATVTASPQVNIGYDATTMGDLETENTLLYSITRDSTNYTSETIPDNFTAIVTDTVYGGGDLAQVTGSTTVNLHKANSSVGTIFGGGNKATISGNTAVNVYNGTVTHDVYGGGALANVGSSANGNTPATTHQVTIAGGTIGNVYGGGLGRLANGNLAAIAAEVYGIVTVTTNGGTVQNVFGCNNNYGSPKDTVAVVIDGGIIGNIYGGGNLAAYTGTGDVSVHMTDGTADYVYGGGLGETAVVNGSTSVTISGNTTNETLIYSDVYGGGSRADVTQNVTVSIEGGRIYNDVYGGGALANTNTANWNESTSELADSVWSEVTGLTVGSSKVFGYYTRSGSEGSYTYTEIKDADSLARADTTYYRLGTPYMTLVSLTGGVIGHLNNDTEADYLGGNVYGGGLGRLANENDTAIAATVYGDVEVTLDGTAFIQRSKIPTKADSTDIDPNPVPFSGRVFGCNNLKGSPKSNVTVRVLKTTMLGANNQPTTGHDENKFDVHSVYGGGNLSPYQPIDTTKTIWVIVNGCDDVTIEKVFGGGNSAGVPDTKVLILACLKIGYAFGGGNGADKIWNGDGWDENEGAPVTRTATIMAYGGRIGQVFSGSDTKGTVQRAYIWLKGKADDSTEGFSGGDYTSNYCPLRITNSYGAGRGADINGDVNFIVTGCNENDEIENVFGGSYDANIRGNITLTITSGIFTHVYGGNDHGGTVGGDITVNIEETEGCAPIIIQHLYGGGREAAYPGTGAKKVTGSSGTGDAITYTYDTVTSGNITVNIKSATRIDNVYGGSYKAATKANTQVNINMIKGSYANKKFKLPYGYRGNTIPNSNMVVNYSAIPSDEITVGETSVEGYYIYDETTQKYNRIDDQDEKADNDVTYYQATTTDSISINDDIGTIGNVYGGCYESEGFLSGNATINIGTEDTAKVLKRRANNTDTYSWGGIIVGADGNPVYEGGKLIKDQTVAYDEFPVLGAHITGTVYGGGCLADIGQYNVDHDSVLVIGNTSVNIGAKNSAAVVEGSSKVTIAGNVYGGGKGSDLTYKCEDAMVTGSTNVVIGNGTVGGTVYGGGMIARVEANTNVTIGFGDNNNSTSSPVIGGNVIGAGQGIATHGYSGLVRGNSSVTVQGETKILGSVYGGGQKASVGRFYVKNVNDSSYVDKDKYNDVPIGMPYAPISGGTCTVTVQGYAEIGPDSMLMNTTTGKPDDAGHVFGAGMGLIPYVDTDTKPGTGVGEGPGRYYINTDGYYTWEGYNDENKYLEYVQTLALASYTDVTIAGHAFIKGSVYGGSENGRVLADTYVKIQENCQIGNGYVQMADDGTYLSKPLSMDRPYSKEEWTEGHLITTNDRPALQALATTNYTSSLPECASWPYGETVGTGANTKKIYAPYDPYAIYDDAEGKYYYDEGHNNYAEGGRPTGSDGHTFYGNVFGGGSGYYPYKNSNGEIKWHEEAGAVGGNTRVEVTGGHILTNLYGGNEMTNVGKGVADTEGGTCTIIFSDSATLGVPRTLGQIAAHPVTCYLFGAGKGDQRVFFNKQTNVNEVNITITGGWIYGSLFGGGEDGHVMRDVTITIDTTATTAPKIGTWGTSYVDGNIFGGGRGFAGDAYTAGNVGGSIDLKIKGGQMLGSIYGGGRLGSVGYGLYAVGEPGYGEMRDDDKNDAGTQVNHFTHGRGHVNIEISGGTIGNDWEYDYIAPGENLATAKVNMPNTTHDANNKLLHTKGGNVYAGGMGRHDRLDGTPITQSETDIDWKKLGNVKSTKLTISGNAVIKSNVYGGGEFGAVTGSHTGNDSKQWGTEIIITGGEIGTTIGTDDNQYQFGSVFGGGMGHNLYQGGDVKNNAFVSIQNATIRNSVYGGGEVGSVGTITNFATLDSIDEGGNYLYKHDDYKEEESAAHSEGAFYNFGLSWPYELLYDKTTGLASVTITGNTQIGGYVFGAAKGSVDVGSIDIKQQRFIEAKIANVRETKVTIGPDDDGKQPTISKSLYGGGEDGHVYENATIVINGGTIAHSVFGGGKGEGVYSDTLLDNTVKPENWRLKDNAELIHSWTAGKVYGNTYVTMNGGSVGYNLYGGGNLASVGKGNYAGGYDDYSLVGYGELPENEQNSKLWATSEGFNPDDPSTFSNMADYFMGSGRTYVNINSGTIGSATGYEEDENHNKFPYGNVFGSSRGKAALNVGQLSPRYRYTPDFFLGYTNETYVTIGNDTVLDAPHIYGSVYGGGQDGHVRRHTNVIINKGEIGVPYSSTDTVIKDRGNVYGAGSGMGQYDTGKKDSGNNPILAYNNSSGSVTCTTNITIKDGIIHQNVYGGGAMASVGPPNAGQLFDEYNDTTSYTIPIIPGVTSTHANVEKHASVSYTEVNIKGGQIGSSNDFSNNNYGGNVYGASRGGDYAAAILKYNEDPNTYTTVLWPTVNVAGGEIAGNVFGGGEMGMVKCGVNVNITGGAIGNDVYGGGALAHTNTSNWDYTRAGINKNTNVWETGSWGTDWAKGKITLSGKRTTTYNTKVNILGGTIGSATSGGDVYGGGLGQQGNNPIEAIVYGDVFVNLNGLDKNDFKNNQIPDSLSRIVPPAPGSEHEYRIATNAKGAIVNRIFGANNLNGSPRGHIKVHVFATQNRDANKDSIHAKYAKHPIQGEEGHEDETLSQYLHRIDTTYKATPAVRSAIEDAVSANNTYNTTQNDENKTALDNAIALMDTALFKLYDVQAVYGGGNLAEYVWCKRDTIINKNQTELVDAARTEVIIDGCDYSSIRQVYGGGNAASAPGTFVEVNGSYEIYELFGGGNGADDYELDGIYYDNPGANVGYHNYTYVVKIGENGYNASTHGTGSVNTPYQAIDNDDADTPENRRAHYAYGSGIATTDIRGGTIHYVFGGSNKKGNISTTALSVYSESDDDCPIDIHETYGGGKDAPIDGDIDLTLDCVKDMDMIFGGSKNADVNSNITLNITNGRFNKVFGGNNTSGAINGSITVNVKESGCVPIEINELYGGGYLAPYSIYGYEKDEDGNYVAKYVQYLDNDNNVDSLKQRIPLTSGATHKNNPRINIISATRIGTVYGGGYQAKVVGSPYVNVNMTNGKVEVKGTVISGDTIYKDGHDTIYAAVIADTIRESGSDVIKEIKHYAPLEIGTIDTIYGGGNLASIIGDTHVEIGTGRWVTSWDSNGNPIYETVDVNGNKYIYKVDTLAVTYSNEECAANNDTIPGAISESTVLTAEQATRLNELLSTSYSAGSSPILADAKKYNETLDGYITTADVKKPAVWAWYDKDTVKLDVQAQPTPARYAANITGDVFGGGKGKADNFTCDKAMIGDAVDLPNPAERNGGTNVIIANGTVGGSVYGGGMIARVEKNTAVTIGFESGIGEPIIGKDVFGAGMGAPTHGYAGLVRGNSSVIIQGNSKVKGSVYGGGMQASLGRYFIATSQALATLHKVRVGMPYDLKNGGKATVIVRGNAEIGPDTLLMTAPGGPQNTGHVFGAGKGTRPYESDSIGRYFIDVTDGNKYKWQSYKNDEDAYIEYIETLGITNETEVTIGGNAFIKGSVYGGSESGFVLKNTHVTIQDNCQIGNGLVQMADDGTYLDNPLNMNRPYSAQEWAEGHLIMTAADSLNVNLTSLVGSNYSSSLPECSSWPYEAPYAPYDKFADANGRYPENSVDTTARGGRPTGSDGHTFYGNVFGGGSGYYPYKPGKWHYKAGSVGGNTVVDITGGHILTSVYGGNEMTNVDSTATINMTGGTLGVPRTLGQIAAHPVTCYLFGAGKGDMRTFFNTETNVAKAIINISDSARIYGSVFGGGDDGHVLGDVTLNILAGDSIMVGDKKIQHPYIGTTGTSYVDGNVFGAGRGFNGEAITAGSVGGNVVTNITGGTILGSVYGGGRLASVGIGFNAPTDSKYGQFTEDTISKGKTYGHITVNISGGTIGNDLEFIAPIPDNIPEGLPDSIDKWTDENWTTWKKHNRIPNTTFDKETRRPTHTKGGNVFGGSMGRLDKLDGTINPMWPQLGQTKTTNVNISGDNTVIKGNVYGGGELGTVRDSSIIVVGKESMTGTTITNPTIEHDVYGGGYGSSDTRESSKASVESEDASDNTHLYTYTPMQWAGIVGIETNVNIYGGHVKRNVYGGGEMATVGIINYEVYGEGEENEGEYKYITKHDDESNGFILSWPYELNYVPGYEGVTTVNIKGGRIGLSGKDYMGPWGSNDVILNKDKDGNQIEEDNGDVYGGGKGIAGDRYTTIFCANVHTTEVNIDLPTPEFDDIEILTKPVTENGESKTKYSLNLKNPTNGISSGIAGSVYGGAEDGHVIKDTKINIKGGYIGHGVYGGGKGKGTFETTLLKLGSTTETYPAKIYSITAGRVFGNTEINMSGGWVMRNIYGGGNMGSVGVGNYAGAADDYSTSGYGEKITGNLWTTDFDPDEPITTDNKPDNAYYFLSSGKTTVTITGGTVGYLVNDSDKKKVSSKDDMPTGNVFGGCRGESAPTILDSPRYLYAPAFFSGYVNETLVIIGDSTKIKDNSYTGPTIYGSVYGGGQDGHVRRDTKVTINKAVIGIPYNTTNETIFSTDLNDLHWLHRGNVYGAGSGIGEYEYDFDYDGDYDSQTEVANSDPVSTTYRDKPIKEKDKSNSAGSVTRFSSVKIKGGTIYRNVYGGGSLSSVGAPKLGQNYVEYRKDDPDHSTEVGKQTLNEVIINGGTIGNTNSRTVGYGGNVYGASRGETGLGSGFATSVWTTVEANSGYIYGNVFGGGESGAVTKDTRVVIGGGTPISGSGGGSVQGRAAQPRQQSTETPQQTQPTAAPSGNAATESMRTRTYNTTRQQ